MGYDHRVAVPVHVAGSLSWLKKAEAPVGCVAVVVEVGRIVVLPEAVARKHELLAELIAGRRGPETDLASALLPHDPPEIVRRLRVTSASILPPPAAFRLRLSRTLLPLLDLDLRRRQRRLYLYEKADHLEVVSIVLAKQGFTDAPLSWLESR
jgi:hypothetical protein